MSLKLEDWRKMLKNILKHAIRIIKPAYFLFLYLNIPVQLFSSIVVIEGMSGAGKSSSIISLYPQLSIKFFVLPELNPEPSSDFKNKSMQEQAEDYYRLWLRRMEIVKQSDIDLDAYQSLRKPVASNSMKIIILFC